MRPSAFTCIAMLVALPSTASAADCWVVSNIKGYSAYADEGYKFAEDGLYATTIRMCFEQDGGTVSGTDSELVKFGESTLVGFGGNTVGNETVEVYQLDRGNKKLLYTKARIGTKTLFPLFSDVVSAFVGDAAQLPQ